MATERTRRQYGTGSVAQRSSDRRWIGSLEAGWTAKGTRRRVTVSAACPCPGTCRGPGKCPGEAEARRRLRDKQREIAATGLPTEGVSARTTVRSWSETWLAELVHHARPKYYATEASLVARWIVPTIGHKPLASLTPGDVRAVTAAVRKAGRSTTTARQAQGTLTRMLRAAIVEGHQVPDRILLVQAPGKATSDRDAVPVDQAIALLRVAENRPDRARWVAALLQGMRQAECLGLTWACVDLVAQTIDVSWQLQALPYLDRAAQTFRVPDGYETRRLTGAWHLVRPKTARGSRVIPLVPWMVTALEQWRAVAPPSPYDLVWPDLSPARAGMPQRATDDRATWWALQAAASAAHPSGRPWVLHEARHATATLLLEGGEDPKVVEAILGHSSIVTSRGYQHVSQTLARQALGGVAQRLELSAGA